MICSRSNAVAAPLALGLSIEITPKERFKEVSKVR